MPDALTPATISLNELVLLAAEDPELYCREFFPKTARQREPEFGHDVWDALEDPAKRLVNLQIWRGGSKTTRCRLATSRRIAYGISRTVLYIGKSEGHATRSLRWLKKQVEFNTKWAQAFGLIKGSKWADDQCEIINTRALEEDPATGEHRPTHIWVQAVGITGSIRGINFDDYRPDFIIVDDVIDDENAGTTEQREKINTLLLGAVRQSLAPKSEAPDAKMAILQTPLNKDDASCQALRDPEFFSLVFGCFDDNGLSRWEERYPTEELIAQKQASIARNQLSLWLREMECKLVNRETSAFMPHWLQYYDVEPTGGVTLIAVDPVPPPSPKELATGLKRKDFEVLMVLRRFVDRYYVLEYVANRGHDPSWTIAEFFRLVVKWHVREAAVETVAYQRTLKWLLEEAMKARRQYITIHDFNDKRSKYDLIVDTLNGIASFMKLFVRPNMTELVEQFTNYPDVSHDDVLNTLAIGVARLSKSLGVGASAEEEEDDPTIDAEEKDVPRLENWRGAP